MESLDIDQDDAANTQAMLSNEEYKSKSIAHLTSF